MKIFPLECYVFKKIPYYCEKLHEYFAYRHALVDFYIIQKVYGNMRISVNSGIAVSTIIIQCVK